MSNVSKFKSKPLVVEALKYKISQKAGAKYVKASFYCVHCDELHHHDLEDYYTLDIGDSVRKCICTKPGSDLRAGYTFKEVSGWLNLEQLEDMSKKRGRSYYLPKDEYPPTNNLYRPKQDSRTVGKVIPLIKGE